MMRKMWMFLFVGTLLVTTLLFVGCGSDANEQTKSAEEHVLVVYNCNPDDWTAPIVKEFQERTGIEVQLVSGGSGELMARVRRRMIIT